MLILVDLNATFLIHEPLILTCVIAVSVVSIIGDTGADWL